MSTTAIAEPSAQFCAAGTGRDERAGHVALGSAEHAAVM